MPNITYNGQSYSCRNDESVLDALTRQGVVVPFSCRNGICHVCLMRKISGKLNSAEQKGLKENLKAKGYFLPCKCMPTDDMELAPPNKDDLYSPAMIVEKILVNDSICKIKLESATNISYRAGQFINLRRSDGLVRSYSLASVPDQDPTLELHIKRMPGGQMSNWILDELKVNDEIEIQEPEGGCFYQPGTQQSPLLLIATGTGAAPLWGIARDALGNGHTGDIYFYHGSRQDRGLYLNEELLNLDKTHRNFHYMPCVSSNEITGSAQQGRADSLAFSEHQDLQGWQVFLCGNPDMVYSAIDLAQQQGAGKDDIFADPFELKDLRWQNEENNLISGGRRASDSDTGKQRSRPPQVEVPYPDPDPEIWQALEQGKLLTKILVDFYDKVFEDPLLSPFFEHTTRQRSIEKVYSFLKRVFTGEKTYFGERPRNAHHWMVISDELFDYREDMFMSFVRKHGVPEQLIKRWRDLEETYRRDIVKNNVWGRVVDGVEGPVDGYGEIVLEVGSLCDSCQQEINKGITVRYHIRTGATFCPSCAAIKGQ